MAAVQAMTWRCSVPLPVAAPYAFESCIDFFCQFTPMRREVQTTDHSVAFAITVDGSPVVITVASRGSTTVPRLECTLEATRALSPAEVAVVIEQVTFLLALDEDLAPFYTQAAGDSAFQLVVDRLRGTHMVRMTLIDAVLWALLANRTPSGAARRMRRDLVDRLGAEVVHNNRPLVVPPSAEQLQHADPVLLSAIVGGCRRAELVKHAAAFCAGSSMAMLRSEPYDEVELRLQRELGLSPWGSWFVMQRGVGRPDRLSPDRSDSESAASRYPNWAGYWSFYSRADAGRWHAGSKPTDALAGAR
jgi:hypothetical protein